MIKKLYSIYDSAAQAYIQPFTVNTDEQAIRAFMEVTSDTGTNPGKYPGDHSMYLVGHFDDHNGLVAAEDPPKRVITGLECVARLNPGVADSTKLKEAK